MKGILKKLIMAQDIFFPNGLRINAEKLRDVRFAGPEELNSNPWLLIVHERVLNMDNVRLDPGIRSQVISEICEIEQQNPGRVFHNYDTCMRLTTEQLAGVLILAGGFLEDSVVTAYRTLFAQGLNVFISEKGVLPMNAYIPK